MSSDDAMLKNFETKFNELFGDTDSTDEESNIIVVTDDQGNNVEFEFLDYIKYNNKEYVVFLTTDECEEVVILEVIPLDDGEGESYVSVNDENLLMNVFEIFKERNKDNFNFVD